MVLLHCDAEKQRWAAFEQRSADLAVAHRAQVYTNLIVLVWCGNDTNGPFISDWKEQGRSSTRNWTAPASRCRPVALGGRYALSGIRYFCTAFVSVTQCIPKYSSQCDIDEMSSRCLQAFSLLLSNDGQSSSMQESSVMKNEKLKATTVRFTDSDLRLIESLQEKLGLGMIHIIRLAIRRLAENENLLPSGKR